MKLVDLSKEHHGKVSDKWEIYLREYDRLLSPFRDLPISLFEIGVQNGGSLEVWAKYFPKARKLIGCDINDNCMRLRYDDPRVSLVIGDANACTTFESVIARSHCFDVIIDDGSHRSGDIIRSFVLYFEKLNEGGLYIAEDLHCSYWEGYEGGLFNPLSSISFFKRLADVVNHEHWGVGFSRTKIFQSFMRVYGVDVSESLLASIHSIEFVNSMCVVKKAPPVENTLGVRIISGSVEDVVKGHALLQGSSSPKIDESRNPWTYCGMLPEDELGLRLSEISQKNEQIAKLTDAVAQRDERIAELTEVVAQRDARVAGLSDAVNQRDTQIVNLTEALNSLRVLYGTLQGEARACLIEISRLRGMLYSVPVAKHLYRAWRVLLRDPHYTAKNNV